jgi:hypothetical protein
MRKLLLEQADRMADGTLQNTPSARADPAIATKEWT